MKRFNLPKIIMHDAVIPSGAVKGMNNLIAVYYLRFMTLKRTWRCYCMCVVHIVKLIKQHWPKYYSKNVSSKQPYATFKKY